ncbi:BhlA/UviB family holin-like peptide [Brevibacillus borstelensis]|uniref:BhlA/UviB family holin-like peptide n=1 Tax=Brevibacillus borstelensis TaxID=45462 RepID=UPI0030BD41AB
MENELWKFFLTQGPFALLFVWLLIFVLKANKEREMQIMKDSKEREMQLMETLDKFSEKYDLILEEVRDIKSEMIRRGG